MEEIIEESKIKKIIIKILAIFLIILMLTFFLTSTHTRLTLAGLIESSNMDNLKIKNTNIIFNNEVKKELNKLYHQNLELEFKVCLSGNIEENTYYINQIYQPETYHQSYNKVIAEPCKDTDLISLHSHPHLRCIPSEQDLKNHNNLKQKNPKALMMIMCEENRFNVYS